MNNNKNHNIILIVDDNPRNLQVVAEILDANGYSIALANNGEKALNYLEKKDADLVLLDIMMPDMDGYEVCLKIKESEKSKDIPVIFLSAKSETQDIVQGFKIGGVDYITKPFNKEEILVRIKNHLELKNARDIIKAKNAELEESEKHLKELNFTKDKFFSIISHDLRNPVSAFVNLTELLYTEFNEFNDEEKFEFVATMYKSSKSVNDLLENLLTWSRAQSGKIKFTPIAINVESIVNKIFSQLELNAKKKNLNLINNTAGKPNVYADMNMITTIVRNLVSNAIKFSRDGGEIIVNAEGKADFLEISIIDNGIGMEKDIINKLFRIDVHHTSLGTNKEKGTGLGLILCKDFAEKNGGTIRVESEPQKGSAFIFTVPIYK